MTKEKRSLNDRVTVYYWAPKGTDSLGHVALKTYVGGPEKEGHYVSFYPESPPVIPLAGDIQRKGIFRTQACGDVDIEISLYSLNVKKINEAYEEFLNSKTNWNLFALEGAQNCSGLVALLLSRGGVNNLFSRWDKIKTGSVLGGLAGGLFGWLGGTVASASSSATVTGVSSSAAGSNSAVLAGASKAAAIAAKGATLFPVVSGVVIVAIIGGVSLFCIGSIMGGAVFGAVVGGSAEYIFTHRLEETLWTPSDICRLIQLAEQAEKDCDKYEFDFSVRCQSLIDRCRKYSNSTPEEIAILRDLKNALTGMKNNNEEDTQYVFAYSNDRLKSIGVFSVLISCVGVDTVKKILSDAMNLAQEKISYLEFANIDASTVKVEPVIEDLVAKVSVSNNSAGLFTGSVLPKNPTQNVLQMSK